jgi:hypothetical protein
MNSVVIRGIQERVESHRHETRAPSSRQGLVCLPTSQRQHQAVLCPSRAIPAESESAAASCTRGHLKRRRAGGLIGRQLRPPFQRNPASELRRSPEASEPSARRTGRSIARRGQRATPE